MHVIIFICYVKILYIMNVLSNKLCDYYALTVNVFIGQTKKKEVESIWSDKRCEVFHAVYRLIQLKIQSLWNPPIAEENFVWYVLIKFPYTATTP